MPKPSIDTLQKIIKSAHIPAVAYAYVEPKEESKNEFTRTSLTFGKKSTDTGYDLVLMSEKSENELKKGIIEFTCKNEGFNYRVIGLDNKIKSATIPWDKLPGFPHTNEKVLADKSTLLSHILQATSEAGHTRSNKVDDNTLFPASSLSKIVFTYLVLQWIQENKIKLNDSLRDIVKKKQIELGKPLDHVLTYARLMQKGEYPEQAKQLTVRHILSHTTGLPNVGADSQSTLAFNSEPGKEYSYSGEAFLYLQKVIEATTGNSLEDLAKKYVFTPLKMTNSTFLPQAEDALNIVKVHTELGQPKNIYIGDPPVHAAGSLLTTAEDFSKFMVAWLKNMEDPVIKDAFKPTSASDFPTCGLGWHIYRNSDDKIIAYQYGENPNTRSFVAINVTDKKGAAFFTNSENGMRIANEVLSSPNLAPIGRTDELFKRMPNYPQGHDPVWQNTLEGQIAEDQGMLDVARDKFKTACDLSNTDASKLRFKWFNKAHPKGYDLVLMSEKSENELKKDIIEFTCKNEGFNYRVIGLDNKIKSATIPWDKLPGFPHTNEKVLADKSTLLSHILQATSEAGHTPEKPTFRDPLKQFEGKLTNPYNEERTLFIRGGSLIHEQFGKEIKLVRISETDFLPEKDQSFRIIFNGDKVSIHFIDSPDKQFTKHPLPSYDVISRSLGHLPDHQATKHFNTPIVTSDKNDLGVKKPIAKEQEKQDKLDTEYDEVQHRPKV